MEKSIIEKYAEFCRTAKAEFERLTDESWNEKLQTLKAGEATPARNRFYDKERREQYNDTLAALRSAANKLADDYEGDLNKQLTEAPTEEALRAVQAFKMVSPDSMSLSDYSQRLQALNQRYGDNAIINAAIRSAANERHIPIDVHPAIQKAEEVDTLRRTANSFFMRHHVPNGSDGARQEISDAEISFGGFILDGGFE